MAGLAKTMAAIPADGTRREYGTAWWDGTEWWAVVRGGHIMARWLDPIQPLQGGKIVVDISTDGKGLATALVVGLYTDQPRPSAGTVTDITDGVMTFTGDDGKTYTTDRYNVDLLVGDDVYLTWDAAKPTVLLKIASAEPPPEEEPDRPPTAPPVIQRDQEVLIPIGTDTYGPFGWGSWAGAKSGGEQVYTGTYGGYTMTGSWFYGAPRPALQDKEIVRVQFRVPDRLAVGSYNAAATIYVYTHTSQYKPGGDVGRNLGPFEIVLAAGQDPAWVDLPVEVGDVIAAGGGISIAGGSYVGLNGRRQDPESGKLLIDWTT